MLIYIKKSAQYRNIKVNNILIKNSYGFYSNFKFSSAILHVFSVSKYIPNTIFILEK